jgi:predicted phosphodiesterase
VNPGSAGPRRFGAAVSVALLDVQDTLVDVRLMPLER